MEKVVHLSFSGVSRLEEIPPLLGLDDGRGSRANYGRNQDNERGKGSGVGRYGRNLHPEEGSMMLADTAVNIMEMEMVPGMVTMVATKGIIIISIAAHLRL